MFYGVSIASLNSCGHIHGSGLSVKWLVLSVLSVFGTLFHSWKCCLVHFFCLSRNCGFVTRLNPAIDTSTSIYKCYLFDTHTYTHTHTYRCTHVWTHAHTHAGIRMPNTYGHTCMHACMKSLVYSIKYHSEGSVWQCKEVTCSAWICHYGSCSWWNARKIKSKGLTSFSTSKIYSEFVGVYCT